MKTQTLLLLGTKKGALILNSDADKRKWGMGDLFFKSWRVMNITFDQRDHRMHAAIVHDVYGPSTHYSDDYGSTWKQAVMVPAFSRPSKSGRPIGSPEEVADINSMKNHPESIKRIWTITPGRKAETDRLYAGVEPAALFISDDRGVTWNLNKPLYDHPHRSEWFPGAGGLTLHTILLDPNNLDRLYVSISTGGCYRSDNAGKSWEPKNRNVRADFLPETYPEFGQCVHSMGIHPNHPEILYQQNHCGVYKSIDMGESWIDIGTNKLPSRFGFPIAIHPHDPDTVFVVPEESEEYKMSINGQFAVWRTTDAGSDWEKLTNGLPPKAYLVVLRQAMAIDMQENAGIYVGTSTGQLFYSLDKGDRWELLVDYLPPIYSVVAVTIN